MHFSDSFRAARWIRFTNLLLQAGLFLGLFGGLNFIAQNHLLRFDLSAGRRHSLSPETKSYLDQLQRDVAITVTLMKETDNEELNQVYRDISGLLREYAYVSSAGAKGRGRVVVEYLDIYQSRKRAEELKLDQPNLVLLSCEGHRRVLTIGDFYRTKERRKEAFQGEAALTAAILDVSSPDKKKIYFLSGHGEMQPDSLDPARGLSQLRLELVQRNFDVLSLDLNLVHKIPDDAALVVVASPDGIRPFEEELLRNYLTTRAGRVILLLDPGRRLGLENLLFDWGVIVYDNVIIDLDPQSLTETNDLRLWRFLPDPVSRITDQMINNKLAAFVGPARVVSEDLGRPDDDGLSVKKLIATSDAAWGETNYRQGPSGIAYTPGQDLKGALGVMVISERLKPANNLPLSVRGGRLAVVGTADLVTNSRIFNPGNLNLFLATINWTVDRDTQLNIPARPIQRFALALSREELVRLRLLLLLAVPGVVACLGFIVYWTRRN